MVDHVIMGIDPGLTGGIAILGQGGLLHAQRMPVIRFNRKGTIDLAALASLFETWKPTYAWIEQQQSMPKQGVASSFLTGKNYGIILGFMAGNMIAHSTVRPVDWKRIMKVPADKAAAIAIATSTFPSSSSFWSKKGDDGVAEAALIALYGARQLQLSVKG